MVLNCDWYVALVRSGYEEAAEKHLAEIGFSETFCPRRKSPANVRGRTTELVRAVFSGYVLCSTDLFTPFLWHAACPAEDRPRHGLVRGFIGGWPPDPVSIESVDGLKGRCDSDGFWVPAPAPQVVLFTPGAVVHVLEDDLLTDHKFVVVWDDGAGVNLKACQNESFRLYIARERVEAIKQETPTSPYRRGLRRYRAKHPRATAETTSTPA